VLLVSECNGRISELRSKGHDIETSTVRDKFGFVFHRLKPESAVVISRAKILKDNERALAFFNNYQPTS
jgi:hypothetical protein